MSASTDPFTRFRARFGRRSPAGDEGEDSGDNGDLFKQANVDNFPFEPSLQASTNAANAAFDNLDAETAAYIQNALDMGITQGMNPLTLANYLSFLVGPQRAEGIARNEMLGAYRDAALSSYNDNSDVVGAWMWSAAAGACVACSEEDGTIHDLDEDMDGETHYACRCSPIPLTQPWLSILGPLGIDVSDITETSILDDYVPLSETFWQKSFEEQADILGSRSAAEAVSRGILEPSDFVGHIDGGAYDGALYTKSLREALADKGMSKAEIADLKSDLLAAVKRGDVEAARQAVEEKAGRAVNVLVEGFRGAPATLDDVNAVAERLFGRRLSQDELVGLVGAPPGSTVRFMDVSTNPSVEQKILKIELHGPSWAANNPFVTSEYDGLRLLYRDDAGRLVMGNTTFSVDDALQGQGLGVRIFADQVQNLSDLGVSRIETFATADGQYTWPRFGYDGKLPTDSRAALREAAAAGDVPKPWGNYRTIQQLMRTPEGRAWWKANSESLDLAFNLAPNSLSQRVLQGYLDEKGIVPGSADYWRAFEKAAQTATDEATFKLEHMSVDELAQAQRETLDAIRPGGAGVLNTQDRVAEQLAAHLANNEDFAKVGREIGAFFRGNTKIRDAEDAVGALLRAWSGGTNNPISLALRQAVRDEFGLAANLAKDAEWGHDIQPGLRAFVRAMYDNTQAWLKDNGITEMPLFRGLTFDTLPKSLDASLFDGVARVLGVDLMSASSFTADDHWAAEFATYASRGEVNYSLAEAARVPANLILSTAQTGFGNLGEAEVLVLGGQYDVLAIGSETAHAALTEDQIAGLLTSAETQTEAATATTEAAAQTDAEKALATAQSKVADLVQSGAPYDDIRAAKWEAAQAQAAVDAEQGGRGAAIFIENPRTDPLNSATFEQAVDTLFGRQLARDELGGLVGAPSGSFVNVYPSSDGERLSFILRGPGWVPGDVSAAGQPEYEAWRSLMRDSRGDLMMNNVSFIVREDMQGQGLGASILADEVDTLSQLGVKYIETEAGGSAAEIAAGTYSANGYYTWPRLGYIGPLPQDARDALGAAIARGEAPASWGSYTHIEQLMRTPEGRTWWKANGMALQLRFDLADGSLSQRMLQQYLDERGLE